jgi:transcriptional regulator with PAS, ATPase and Fis domain
MAALSSHYPGVVVLWDQIESRRQRLQSAMRNYGATCYCPNELREDRVGIPSGSLAFIAIGTNSSDQTTVLAAMHLLKKHSTKVIGYGDGINTWPVVTRCRLLTAGARLLLDSATPDFLNAVGSVIAQFVKAKAEQCTEQHRLRGLMQGLGIMAESSATLAMFGQVLRLSSLSDIPVLITGETGTGKELVARAIHRLDPKRSKGPFVPVNCAAIVSGLAESEFFGHQRGAFTGAEKNRKGLMQSAEGGVLFLDEVAELSLGLQAKLLRVLQENRIRTVGEEKEIAVNFRMLAATNRNVAVMVEEETFRRDLYYRLNVLSVVIPPLHQRSEDVGTLIRHFVEKHGARSGVCPVSLSPAYVEALTHHRMPGNVRQLENIVVKSLAYKEDNRPLDLPDLPPEVLEELSTDVLARDENSAYKTADLGDDQTKGRELGIESQSRTLDGVEKESFSQIMAHYEKLLLSRALSVTNGNQSRAAQLLRLSTRTMYNKLRRHRLLHIQSTDL